MPDTASYITCSLIKDGVPPGNSKVGINFVFGSKFKSKSCNKDVYNYLLIHSKEFLDIFFSFLKFDKLKVETYFRQIFLFYVANSLQNLRQNGVVCFHFRELGSVSGM